MPVPSEPEDAVRKQGGTLRHLSFSKTWPLVIHKMHLPLPLPHQTVSLLFTGCVIDFCKRLKKPLTSFCVFSLEKLQREITERLAGAPAGPGDKGRMWGERPTNDPLHSVLSIVQMGTLRLGALCHLCLSGRKSIVSALRVFFPLNHSRMGFLDPQGGSVFYPNESHQFSCLAFPLPHGVAVGT